MIDIFISHSSKDSDVAEALINFLRASLNISAAKIRCTSVDGYRLPGGTSTDVRLKQELRDATCFIALLTPESLKSTYVLFELGARWGAQLHFTPLLARGITVRDLQSPLSSINALSCESRSQLHQLINELATRSQLTPESAAVYENCLQRLRDQAAMPPVDSVDHEREQAKPTKDQVHGQPTTETGRELLRIIQEESNPAERGLVQIVKNLRPDETHYFPKLQYAGSPLKMRNRIFREAIEELVAKKWVYPGEPTGNGKLITFEYRGENTKSASN